MRFGWNGNAGFSQKFAKLPSPVNGDRQFNSDSIRLDKREFA